MISKSFLKSSIIFTVGGSLPMLAGLILLPFYTNILSRDHYTQILFYISMSFLFQILFSFSIESFFGVKYSQLSEEPHLQKKLIGTVSALLLLIGLGLTTVMIIFGDYLFKIIYKPDLQMEFWPYGFYSILTAFFNSYFKASSICLIYLKQSKLFLISNVLNFITTVVISIGGLYLFPETIIGPIFGRLISGVVIFLTGHYVFTRFGNFVLERSFLKELANFCTPYLFYIICGWVLTQIDRYFLQTYISKNDLNAYDLMLKCFIGIEFIQNSLSAVIFPKIFEIWNKNKNNTTTLESNRYFNVFTVVNIIQLILFCVFIPIIYQLIIKNRAFYEAESYIGILSAGYALRSILNFYLSSILFTKSVGTLLKIFGSSALIQVVLMPFAVRFYGLNGAIYTGIAVKVLQVLFCIVFTKSIFIYRFSSFKIIVIPAIYVAFNVIQFFVFKEYSLWLYISQLFIFGLIFYFVFKREILKLSTDLKLFKLFSRN